MAEGATSVFLDGGSLNPIREAVRVGIDLLQGSEDVGFSLYLNHLLIFVIESPVMIGVWARWGWPRQLICVEGGWAGHDGAL